MERTVRSVAQQKKARASSWTSNDIEKARRLVSIFNALRPFYPAGYVCLFDSLAMIEFLARYRLYANWVYGVEIEPFNAHCWVQQSDLLFNDIIEEVQRYTPIMAV